MATVSTILLLYVPTANDPNVVYAGVTEGEVLSALQGIGTPGSHVEANSGQLPYSRGLDLRISQEIPLPSLRLRASSVIKVLELVLIAIKLSYTLIY